MDRSAKPGRPSRGERGQITLRPPTRHLAVFSDRAKAAGLPLGDYLVRQLATIEELDTPAWLERDKDQPAVPGLDDQLSA